MGGTSDWVLNVSDLSWDELPAAASNTTTPTDPPGTGTVGRFRYSPAKDVFVVVSDVDENVFAFRLP